MIEREKIKKALTLFGTPEKAFKWALEQRPEGRAKFHRAYLARPIAEWSAEETENLFGFVLGHNIIVG